MINELMTLANSMESAGIMAQRWHPILKPLPNASEQKPCYRIVLSEEGNVVEINTIDLELVPKLKKFEPSNGSSFPGLNICPLFRLPFEKNSDTDKEIKKLLKSWRDGKASVDLEVVKRRFLPNLDSEATLASLEADFNNWDAKLESKLQKCMDEIPGVIRQEMDSLNREQPTLTSVIDRASTTHRSGFRSAILRFIDSILNSNRNLPADLVRLLFHEGSATKSPDKDRGQVSIYFEIDDWQDTPDGIPAISTQMVHEINEILLASSDSKLQAESNSKSEQLEDAYGNGTAGARSKMPEVKLPILGGVKLRAMNSESPCQTRYDTIDSKSFLVGSDSQDKTKAALEWLSQESHEGIAWRRSGMKELIFAFPEKLTQVPVGLALVLGDPIAANNEIRFAKAAKDVIASLNGIVAAEKRDIAINVFALRKMDKARTKVVFDGTYTAQGMIDAAQGWQTGCENLPEIRWRQWGAKKGEIVDGAPETPFPLQFSNCLNRVWKQDGSTACESQDLQTADGVALLMNDFGHGFLEKCLKVALSNSTNLLCFLGSRIVQNQILPASKGFDHHKSIVPSCLGLILHKLQIQKDNYMKDIPFLLGQMLKISDEIHALYCKVVRKDSYPQQLLGNALMVSALESPNQALATLATRVNAYLGWAKTHRFKKQNTPGDSTFTTDKQAGWYISLYERVSDQIANAGAIPDRFDDKAKAQLLLGYLASHPKKEND